MGSSDTGGGVSDCSVGSIVWVRRRNGSWWPGKILRTEELPAAHVTSPRSGTPVKLLGREDASVDWYNLEKSKRVKAFRCGEFDNCIERAEAAQGMPPKKREKYARREDAILHALELERQLMEKKCGKTGNSFCARSKASPDAITSSEYVETGCGKQYNFSSDQPSCSSLFEKNGTDHHMYEENHRDREQHSGEDDSSGLLPRMRGLQDFGLRTTPSSREELPGAPLHAKRSKYADLQYDSVEYAHDTHTVSSSMEIVVSKVEESTYPVNVSEDQISGSTEDTETDCSETDSLESDSDLDMTGISDGSASIELHPKYPRRMEVHENHGSVSSSDDIDGLSHPFPHSPVASGTSVSKWQLKGNKRNNRNLGKQAFEASDFDVSKGCMKLRMFKRRKSVSKADLMDKSFSTHIPRHLSTGLHSSNEINDLEAWAWNNQSAMRGYMDDGMEYPDPSSVGKHYFGGRGMLIDVELQVNANNYKRDVPMISLMSKLNGHAIVGHSIQVEPLENGSSANPVPTADCFSSKPLESPALPCVWRTGRRTANFRIPRPFLSSVLDCNTRETAQLVHHGVQHPFASNHGSSTQQRANMARRNFSQYPVERKFSRNSTKKISQSPNQKIRSLSSIPAQAKHHSDPNTGAIHSKNIPTAVACIPVSLVFSRLHQELVGRHP